MTEVVIALCPSCASMIVNPPEEQERCEHCRRTSRPLRGLVRRTFPAGCRIDPAGAIYASDDTLLFERPRATEFTREVERMRRLLASYDSGSETEGGVVARNFRELMTGVVEGLKAGNPVGYFSSRCGGEDLPSETVRAEIEIGHSDIIVRPI